MVDEIDLNSTNSTGAADLHGAAGGASADMAGGAPDLGETVAIPTDAPEASIPDTPQEGAGEPMSEPPATEGEPAPAAPAEGPLPVDQSEWEQTTIIEGLDTPDEHQDQFWRNGNFGIELDQTGAYEAYAIVDETPVMLDGSPYESFEEAVAGINEELSHKSLGEGKEEAAPAESGEAEEEDAPAESESGSDESESESKPEPEPKESESESESKPESKKEDEPEEKDSKDDKKDEKTKPSKKSVSGADDTDSIRGMIGAYWNTKTHGVGNLPRARSLMDIQKAQNRTMTVGGVTVRIGCDRDAINMNPGKPNRNDGSYKHVDPSVRNAMAPAKGKTMDTKATSVDALYDKHDLGHAKTGVKPAKEVY